MPRIKRYDYLIVGGGIAGVTAAETIRQKDTSSSICIVSKESAPLYSRVFLPHYIRGKIPREKVFLRTLDDYTDKNIDVLVGKEIVVANFDMHEVRLSDKGILNYGKLLIATGSTPLRWRIIGEGLEPILRLQTIDDADRAEQVLRELKGKGDALVVGGGFIALEFLESAVAYGYKAHLLIKEKRFFAGQLDELGWGILEQNFARHGITSHTESEVKKLEQDDKGILIAHTSTGETIKGVWLGLGIGVERNYGTFQGGGLKIGRGIVVNEYLELNVPDVWAAGDVAEVYYSKIGKSQLVGNWNSAFMQGRTAGINMAALDADNRVAFDAVPTYSINSLGYNITMVGDTSAGDDIETVARVWPDGISYERFFLRGGILQGAILINRFADKPSIAKLIKNNADFSEKRNNLHDPDYDITKFSAS